jgi:regulator of protease activity HflC (stomatin/prohibitin superfamily)
MEKQMRAERERREAILLAEGEKRSNILKAEGAKESEILRAEAKKEALIKEAEAKKEALIKEAEGQSESILKINEATAAGLKMIKVVGVDQGVLTLKAYEALGVMADGKATKIIVPSNLQELAGLVTSIKEIATDKVDE